MLRDGRILISTHSHSEIGSAPVERLQGWNKRRKRGVRTRRSATRARTRASTKRTRNSPSGQTWTENASSESLKRPQSAATTSKRPTPVRPPTTIMTRACSRATSVACISVERPRKQSAPAGRRKGCPDMARGGRGPWGRQSTRMGRPRMEAPRTRRRRRGGQGGERHRTGGRGRGGWGGERHGTGGHGRGGGGGAGWGCRSRGPRRHGAAGARPAGGARGGGTDMLGRRCAERRRGTRSLVETRDVTEETAGLHRMSHRHSARAWLGLRQRGHSPEGEGGGDLGPRPGPRRRREGRRGRRLPPATC